ncbi:MAG: hypothetical protein M3P49_13545, partial [Actinomycetota bacterium]|nr:hypothetical protein [Actinomycetota bacterium]
MARTRRPVDGRGSTEISRKQQMRPNIIRNASVPPRGYVWEDGERFNGLLANRLAFRTVTDDEQADNSTTSRILAPGAVLNSHIGEQIGAGKLPNIGGLNGDVPVEKLPNIPAGKLPK